MHEIANNYIKEYKRQNPDIIIIPDVKSDSIHIVAFSPTIEYLTEKIASSKK